MDIFPLILSMFIFGISPSSLIYPIGTGTGEAEDEDDTYYAPLMV